MTSRIQSLVFKCNYRPRTRIKYEGGVELFTKEFPIPWIGATIPARLPLVPIIATDREPGTG